MAPGEDSRPAPTPTATPTSTPHAREPGSREESRRPGTLLADFGRALWSPSALYASIHEGRPSASWIAVTVYCAIYVAGTMILHLLGRQPVVEPWLALDLERYYLVQTLYEAPLVFLLWIQAAGVIRVAAQPLGGRGRFETLLRMTGWSLWAPWFLLIPFDIFPTVEPLYNAVLLVCGCLTLAGTAIATKIEEGIGWPGAVGIAGITVGAIGLQLFTFIR